MKPSIRNLTATTAIALGLAAQSSALLAQPYEMLAGTMIPPCTGDGEAVDAGTLEAEAFGEDPTLPAEIVRLAANRDDVCLDDEGKLELSGASAELAGLGAALGAAAGADAGAEATAGSEATADTEATVETDTTAETDATGGQAAQADEPAAAETTGEAAPETAEAGASEAGQTETATDQGRVEVEAEAEATAETDATAEGTAQAPDAEPAPATEEQAPVAAAAADENGREAEPAEVQETVVTEENSRSSSEEFETQQNAEASASGSSGGGLSNFEKFALGAAGIVALDAILGRDREVVQNSGDRVVIRNSNGDLEVLRDDDVLLRRPGSEIRTETFSDGSTRTTVTRPNGAKIITISDATGRVVKRTRITADGREIVIIDDTEEQVTPVDVSRLPPPTPERRFIDANDRNALEAALRAQTRTDVNRSFTLGQVREYREVRDLVPAINIDAINFRTNSAAIEPQEAEELIALGEAMSAFIQENPDELFLVEGHTDAVGDPVYNLALSDRRAESVALALTEYFDVPPENMIIQGYGESELLIPTTEAERANRRAVVRRVTPLMR